MSSMNYVGIKVDGRIFAIAMKGIDQKTVLASTIINALLNDDAYVAAERIVKPGCKRGTWMTADGKVFNTEERRDMHNILKYTKTLSTTHVAIWRNNICKWFPTTKKEKVKVEPKATPKKETKQPAPDPIAEPTVEARLKALAKIEEAMRNGEHRAAVGAGIKLGIITRILSELYEI